MRLLASGYAVYAVYVPTSVSEGLLLIRLRMRPPQRRMRRIEEDACVECVSEPLDAVTSDAHTASQASSETLVADKTATYTALYELICVFTMLCVIILMYMCPHTAMCVSSETGLTYADVC
jgi:hypothetical protein